MLRCAMLALLLVAPAAGVAQAPPAGASEPFVVEYYYKARWGHALLRGCRSPTRCRLHEGRSKLRQLLNRASPPAPLQRRATQSPFPLVQALGP